MSFHPYQHVAYSPDRFIDLATVQIAQYPEVKVQDLSNVKYFAPSDDEKDDDVDGKYTSHRRPVYVCPAAKQKS